MVRFSGFDGLRGLLAWTVVFHHIVLFTGLSQRFPWLTFIHPLGDGAVSVFIMLSGFVITHLLIVKPEPYWLYIRRRFLRIYPIYFVALVLGIAGTYLNFQTFLHSDQTAFVYPNIERLAQNEIDIQGFGFIQHLVAHLTMLHGAIPSSLLNEAQYTFLGPAWSLSLEWQFYLVAPLIIFAAKGRLSSVLLSLVAVASLFMYSKGVFGTFYLPSFLPGAGLYFSVGIATRLLLEGGGKQRGHWLALAIVFIAAAYVHGRRTPGPFIVWATFCFAALTETKIKAPVMAFFDSKALNHLGTPSYSTYLLHMPILQALMYVCSSLPTPTALAIVVTGTLAGTYLASLIAYRFIEQPGIDAGKRLAGARINHVAASS